MTVAQFFDSAAQGEQSLQFSSSLRRPELAALAADLQLPRASAADYIGLAAADQWGHPALVRHRGHVFAAHAVPHRNLTSVRGTGKSRREAEGSRGLRIRVVRVGAFASHVSPPRTHSVRHTN